MNPISSPLNFSVNLNNPSIIPFAPGDYLPFNETPIFTLLCKFRICPEVVSSLTSSTTLSLSLNKLGSYDLISSASSVFLFWK